jgi:hypothetical protein
MENGPAHARLGVTVLKACRNLPTKEKISEMLVALRRG